MQIGYTPEQEALRDELRAYYDQLLDEETVEELGPGRRRRSGHQARSGSRWAPTAGSASAGPRSTAARAATPIEQFIFFDESMRAGAPVPMLTLNTVGPTIMHFGTDEQKEFFLPKILAGEIHFCIGYTEPGAGTDLAALQTRAVRDGDEYVINGQKMWTSPRRRRRLLLARGAHRPRGQEAQGHLDDHRPDGHARHHHPAAPPDGRARHQRHVLRRRAGAGQVPGRRGERRLGAHHQPAQPRARHALLASGIDRAHTSTTCARWAQDTKLRRRPPRDRPGVGAAQPGPGARPARVPEARQLEGGVVGGRRAACTRPTPRR